MFGLPALRSEAGVGVTLSPAKPPPGRVPLPPAEPGAPACSLAVRRAASQDPSSNSRLRESAASLPRGQRRGLPGSPGGGFRSCSRCACVVATTRPPHRTEMQRAGTATPSVRRFISSSGDSYLLPSFLAGPIISITFSLSFPPLCNRNKSPEASSTNPPSTRLLRGSRHRGRCGVPL